MIVTTFSKVAPTGRKRRALPDGRGMGGGDFGSTRREVAVPWHIVAVEPPATAIAVASGRRKTRQRIPLRGAIAGALGAGGRPLWIDRGRGRRRSARVTRAVKRSGARATFWDGSFAGFARNHRREPALRGLRFSRAARRGRLRRAADQHLSPVFPLSADVPPVASGRPARDRDPRRAARSAPASPGQADLRSDSQPVRQVVWRKTGDRCSKRSSNPDNR